MLTAKEVAEKLRVTTPTVYEWCRTGKMPCYKIGRLTLISEEGLARFLSNNEFVQKKKRGRPKKLEKVT